MNPSGSFKCDLTLSAIDCLHNQPWAHSYVFEIVKMKLNHYLILLHSILYYVVEC